MELQFSWNLTFPVQKSTRLLHFDSFREEKVPRGADAFFESRNRLEVKDGSADEYTRQTRKSPHSPPKKIKLEENSVTKRNRRNHQVDWKDAGPVRGLLFPMFIVFFCPPKFLGAAVTSEHWPLSGLMCSQRHVRAACDDCHTGNR